MGSRGSILRIQIYERAMPPLLMVMAGSTLLELLPTKSTLASYVWLISAVNFTCQLSWAKETQILSKAVFLSLSVRVFLKEINIWVGRLSREDPSLLTWIGILQLTEMNWTELNLLRTKENNKVEEGQSCSLRLSWDLHLLPWGMIAPLDSTWTCTIVSPWFLGIWLWTRSAPSTFLGLQLADSRLWDFSVSIVMWANPSL